MGYGSIPMKFYYQNRCWLDLAQELEFAGLLFKGIVEELLQYMHIIHVIMGMGYLNGKPLSHCNKEGDLRGNLVLHLIVLQASLKEKEFLVRTEYFLSTFR